MNMVIFFVFLLTFFLFLEKCRYNIDLIFVIFIFFYR